jgi:putative ABC transport system substrate-binding protein
MQLDRLKRREFISLLGGAATWPTAARGQQGERMRRIGVLFPSLDDDDEYQARLVAFLQALRDLGWVEGRNMQLDVRRPKPTAGDIRKHVAELVAATPDVILTSGGTTLPSLLQTTRTIPIFASVVDPVGAGFVRRLSRPGGNATGFMQFEYSLSGKWLELIKQSAPRTTHAVVIRDPSTTSGIGQFAVIQSVASSIGLEVVPGDGRDAGEISRAIEDIAGAPNGALIVTTSAAANAHRDQIIALAARHRLFAIYPRRAWVERGGLMSYGPDIIAASRQAAGYVDRILKGEKPADLPVQAPNKYELVINRRTLPARSQPCLSDINGLMRRRSRARAQGNPHQCPSLELGGAF